MRILSFLFTSLLIIAIVVGGGGLLAREGLMILGSSTVRSSLTILHQLSRDNLQFARQCREKRWQHRCPDDWCVAAQIY